VFRATWQCCRVHFMRNALAHAGKSGRRVVAAFIATAFAQDHADTAKAQWRQVADQVRPKLPKLAALLDDAEEDVLACMTFPYHVMKRAGLLLAPHTRCGRQRWHDGKVATPASNPRWAADVFEISCWNGDAVRVACAIDSHDREILAWTASPRGIGGIAVRDLMLLAVERRFAALRGPQPVE
jgi:transposase InsO family protein